jgi:hypothetical protein
MRTGTSRLVGVAGFDWSGWVLRLIVGIAVSVIDGRLGWLSDFQQSEGYKMSEMAGWPGKVGEGLNVAPTEIEQRVGVILSLESGEKILKSRGHLVNCG